MVAVNNICKHRGYPRMSKIHQQQAEKCSRIIQMNGVKSLDLYHIVQDRSGRKTIIGKLRQLENKRWIWFASGFTSSAPVGTRAAAEFFIQSKVGNVFFEKVLNRV